VFVSRTPLRSQFEKADVRMEDFFLRLAAAFILFTVAGTTRKTELFNSDVRCQVAPTWVTESGDNPMSDLRGHVVVLALLKAS